LAPSKTLQEISRALGLLYFSSCWVRLGRFRNGWGTLAGLLILGLGLLSTGSRGGFLGAFLGLLLWACLAFREVGAASFRQKGKDLISWKFPWVPISGTTLLLLVGWFGSGFFQRLFSSFLHIQDSLAVSRLHIWGPAWTIARSNPLLGTGLDTFKIAFPYYSGIEFNLIDGMFTSSRMAHNELLQMAATTGLVGLAAYIGVIAVFGYVWWQAYRLAAPSARWTLIALLCAAVAFHVQNLFSFGVAAIDWLWFFLLAGVQFYYRKNRPKGSGFWTLPRKAMALLFGLTVLLFPLQRLAADIAFGHGSVASDLLKRSARDQDLGTLIYYSEFEIGHMWKATHLSPLDVKYQLYLGLAYEHRAALDPTHAQDCYLKALDCYQQAIAMSPANAYYYNDEGRIYDDLSRIDPSYRAKSETAYGKAVQWAPASPYFLINWALALERTGKEKEGEEQLQKAFSYSPSFTAKTLGQMAEGAYLSGDKKTAFEMADKAVRGNTSSAEAHYYRGYLYLREKEKKKALADFETTKNLAPTKEKNPTIQLLDQFIGECEH